MASLISDDARALVGTVLAHGRREIERGAQRVYREALGDPNPLWDEGLCPPTFLGGPGGNYPEGQPVEIPDLPPTRLNGGQDVEWRRPVRVGETLRYEMRLASIEEREGRAGPMVFLVRETVFWDTGDAEVARARITVIARP